MHTEHPIGGGGGGGQGVSRFNHQRISQRDVRKSLRLLLPLTQLKKKNLTLTLPVQSQGQWLIKPHLENAQVENGPNSDYLYNLDDTSYQVCIIRVINKYPQFVFLKNRTFIKMLL